MQNIAQNSEINIDSWIDKANRPISVCKLPRTFECVSPSNFRTQGSFIRFNSRKVFEREVLSSDSVAKSAT